MKLINLNNRNVLAEATFIANTFWKRLRGLMFTKSLPTNSAMHIIPCRSIHTFFMNYAIDVVYLDEYLQVVAIDESIAPWRVGRFYQDTVSVVELPAGKAAETNTKVGHYLKKI